MSSTRERSCNTKERGHDVGKRVTTQVEDLATSLRLDTKEQEERLI